MKIVHRDEDTLVLRPGGAGSILFGLIFVIAGLGVVLLTSIEYRLSCQRASGQAQCQLSQGLFGFALQSEPVNGLRGARLDSRESTSHSNGRRSTSIVYQVVLITASGERRVGSSSNIDVAGQTRFVENTNTFVQRPNLTSLDIAYGGAKLWWFGAIFVLAGLVVAVLGLQATFTTWTFDRAQNTFVQRSETLLGVKVRESALQDLADVQVATSRGASSYSHRSHHRSGPTYRVELVFSDGNVIPLTLWYSSGYQDKERTAAVIREFLQS